MKAHLAYLYISKAYYMMRRDILWSELPSGLCTAMTALLPKVKWKFDALYLSISVDKSQIVSPTDDYNNIQFSIMSLSQYWYMNVWKP